MENNYKMDQNGNVVNPTAPAQPAATPVQQNAPAMVPVPAPVTEPWYARLAKSKAAKTALKVIGVGGALVGAFFLGKNSNGSNGSQETETVDYVVDDNRTAE